MTSPESDDPASRPATGRWPTLLTVAGAVGVVAAAFLPWHRSGEVGRDAFELARAADALDLVDTAPARALLWAWYAVPAAVGALWLSVVLRREAVAAAVGATVGAVAVVAAAVVIAAPGLAEIGAWLALASGAVTVTGAFWLGGARWRRR